MIHIVKTLSPNFFYPIFYDGMDYNDYAICYNEYGIAYRQYETNKDLDMPAYLMQESGIYISTFIIQSYIEAINNIENINIDFLNYNKNVSLSSQQINHLKFLKKITVSSQQKDYYLKFLKKRI